MKRAAKNNGVKVPPGVVDVRCRYNGGREPCFTRKTAFAHPECIWLNCSVCGRDYTSADHHEPIWVSEGVVMRDESGLPVCHHESNVFRRKNPAKRLSDYDMGREISDVDALLAEVDSL